MNDTYQLIVSPQADFDVNYAIEWYEMQHKGLGKKFKIYYEKTVKQLKKYPFLYYM